MQAKFFDMEKTELEVVRQIAKGGQKVVYLAAKKDNPCEQVIIKEASITSAASLQRIMREVSFLSSINSPYFPKNLGSSFDLKTMTITIIEEFVEGSTLRNCMQNYSDWPSIQVLLNQLIDGLSSVWSRHVVHRDLKPENIIIKTNGTPCIIDFGIARFLDMDSITNTLQQMGPCTPLYASPEQLRNDKTAIDLRTDFYALGIIALELYLQQHPFHPDIVGGGMLYDNLLQGKYALSSATRKEDDHLKILANNLLQVQPYMRPRTIEQLRNLINNI